MPVSSQGTQPARPLHLRHAIRDIIARRGVRIVFQPIVDLQTARIAGLEALTRAVPDGDFEHAGHLFEVADHFEMSAELESVCRQTALQVVAESPDWSSDILLFMNSSPAVFSAEGFADALCKELREAGRLTPHDVVVEFTEKTEQEIADSLTGHGMPLREAGFQIALDDVGAGISGLNRIMALRPNWIKLDRELVCDIDFDPLKQNLMRFFVNFAKLGNMRIVAEGIERREELATLIELGVSHGQGFFLARPGEIVREIAPAMQETILNLGRVTNARKFRNLETTRLTSLTTPTRVCSSDTPIIAVKQELDECEELPGVIVDSGKHPGWLGRKQIMQACADGRSDEPISHLLSPPPPALLGDITMSEALGHLSSRADTEQQPPLIVTDAQGEMRIVQVRDLLLAAADVHRRAPSHVAALSGLPNRVHADQWLSDHIRLRDPSDIAFVDLRDFSAYNLAYGFEMGDHMLQRLVGLLHAHVDVREGAMIAHLGGDQFILSCHTSTVQQLKHVASAFSQLESEFFSAIDIACNAFSYEDAAGVKHAHPLTSVRLVHVAHPLLEVADPREVYLIGERKRIEDRASREKMAQFDGEATDRRQSA